ncbi:hypothetical protein [Pseudolysinimonas sp.]
MNLPQTAPLTVSTPGVDVVALKGGKWRVTSRTGTLLGHLEAVAGGGYRAMRFSVRERGFRMLGDFRTATDAADALRFA